MGKQKEGLGNVPFVFKQNSTVIHDIPTSSKLLEKRQKLKTKVPIPKVIRENK